MSVLKQLAMIKNIIDRKNQNTTEGFTYFKKNYFDRSPIFNASASLQDYIYQKTKSFILAIAVGIDIGKQEFRRTDFGSRLLAAEGEGCV